MNAAPHINGGGSPPPSPVSGASGSIRFRAKNADAPAIVELRTHRQWVCWRHKEIVNKDGSTKLTKPPVNPIHGGGASHSKPEDWGTYEQARVFALTRKLAGVGFVLSERDDFTGIDLDKCRNKETGEIEPWARAILDLRETYAEISPSGTGIRLIARGKVEHATKCDPAHVEIYGKQRYLTITGEHLPGAPTSIEPAPQTIAALVARAAEFQAAAEAAARAAQPEKTDEPAETARVINFVKRDGTKPGGMNPPKKAKPKAATGIDFFRAVNDAAMSDPGWFLNIFSQAKWYPGSGDYRVSSDALGRNLEEDISFKIGESGGIVDFGVADMGDARGGKRTPVDIVIEHGGAPDARHAAFWLCERLGKSPEHFGWGERAPDAPPESETWNGSKGGQSGHEGAQAHPSSPKHPLIEAMPYGWPDPTSIPRRQWLYGRHYIRRYVSATIAAGGVGKSSLTIAEAVAMISGRALLHGIKPVAALNVWIWNGEDPLDELHRRIAATLKAYDVRREDCRGKLYVNSGRDSQVVVAEMIRGEIKVQRPLVEAVKATIIANQIDVMIVDPFVSSHRVNENDNAAIDVVAREWARIADATGCAIDLVHHARKVGDVEVTVEAARGASAMISAARSARALNQMTAEDAKKAGVENRRTYFRVTTGKANMSPAPEASQWFEMKSVDLENGDHFTPSDFIGVVSEWKWPDPLDDVTVADLETVKKVVAAGQWRENAQARDWVGKAVAEALRLDADDPREKEKIKGLLRVWIKNGALRVVRRPDANGDERPFVEVNPDTS